MDLNNISEIIKFNKIVLIKDNCLSSIFTVALAHSNVEIITIFYTSEKSKSRFNFSLKIM